MEEATEIIISPETLENIKKIVAHEGAHAFVSLHLGIPLMKIELNVNAGRRSGIVIWNDLTGVTAEQQGIVRAAGVAGELFVMGEKSVRESGFKGLKTDSKKLNQLGFKTQDEKARLLSKAQEILTTQKDGFLSLQALLTELLTKSIQVGKNSLVLEIDDLKELGIQKSEFRRQP